VNDQDQAETIRRRMAELRRELACDVREVSRSAKAMTEPSYYVKKFPWATLAVAAGVGFLLIPKKRKEVAIPDPKMLADLIAKHQVRVEASAGAKETKGAVETLLMMGVTWAAKAGLKYIGQQLTTIATKKAEEMQAAKENSSAPLDETSDIERV
jgi:hypothetical protein